MVDIDDPLRPEAAGSSIDVTQAREQTEHEMAKAREPAPQTSEVQSPRSDFVQPAECNANKIPVDLHITV